MKKETNNLLIALFALFFISLFPNISYAQRARVYEKPPIRLVEPVPTIKIPRYMESIPSLQGKAYEAPTSSADRKWRSFVERESYKPVSKASAAISRQFEMDAEASHYVKDKNVSIISIIPESKTEFNNIFKTESKPKDMEIIGQADSKIKSITQNRINAFNQQSIEENLVNTESKIVIFIGHNQKGRIYLRDGSDISIRYLRDFCVDIGKYCIFISCESRSYLGDGDYGVSRKITYEEAGNFANEIIEFHKFSVRSNMKNQEVALLLPGLMEELGGKISVNVKITVISSGIGGGFVVLVQVYDE